MNQVLALSPTRKSYDGKVAVITSHDRWFLDRVATHIPAWEADANWFWLEGNFAAC
jgi:ATPase subunit of ABC transporter with duplicated ATPase domains